MIDRGFYDHVNPDGEGPGERLSREGVIWRTFGENIALHQTADSAHNAFMDEPPNQPNHRGNILNVQFTHAGIGAVRRPDGMLVITQDFLAEK